MEHHVLADFFSWNTRLCSSLDRVLVRDSENASLERFLTEIRPEHRVADVGGGKQPARLKYPDHAWNGVAYEGLDIDDTELRSAPPGIYSRVRVVDITDVPGEMSESYDRIICRNTLEHVRDMDRAIGGLAMMARPNGKIYVKTTCRFALYARLNRILPEVLKRRLLFFLFPHKSGDGFPAFYDRCTVREISDLASKHGLNPSFPVNQSYYSTYFTFLMPVYFVWRFFTGIQYLINKDYSERFELVFEKRD
ncbi:class I SAM-dependent methyltransferase [Amaricoccus solimangrovi]|nr:class I SAM-dependent methyltransferase [Amaricoccus solimangrovi]